MEKENLSTADQDPFAPENIGAIQFIMLARIYDVLMAMYKEQNATGARALLEQHMGGTIVGSAPYMNGRFVTNIVNETEPDTGV